MQPRVTVLMPVYNGEKYLKESMDSILGQTFKDFEFLIINDGSTDNSQRIIESYTDPRIRLINQDNQGLSTTLNNGIDLSLGEFIARMDQDDISIKSRLYEQVKFMDSNLEVGVCGSYAVIINEVGLTIGSITHYLKHEEIKAQLLFGSPLAHPTVIFRRSILQINNLKYLDIKSEDYDLWVRCSEFTQLANVNKFLFKYRFGNGDSQKLHKKEYNISALHIIKQNLLRLGDFSETEIYTHESMYESSYVPDKYFLKKSFYLLNKIRLLNKNARIYDNSALNFIIFEKWIYSSKRMGQKKILFSSTFWLYSLIFLFRLSFNSKINLIKILIIKLSH